MARRLRLAGYADSVESVPPRAFAWDRDASARRMAIPVERSISSAVRPNLGWALFCNRLRRPAARVVKESRFMPSRYLQLRSLILGDESGRKLQQPMQMVL